MRHHFPNPNPTYYLPPCSPQDTHMRHHSPNPNRTIITKHPFTTTTRSLHHLTILSTIWPPTIISPDCPIITQKTPPVNYNIYHLNRLITSPDRQSPCQDRNLYEKRTPVLFKLEYEGSGMVSLCSKTYHCFGEYDKPSTKGLTKQHNTLDKNIFMAVLTKHHAWGGKNVGFKTLV
jgi:hypothetical protein